MVQVKARESEGWLALAMVSGSVRASVDGSVRRKEKVWVPQ